MTDRRGGRIPPDGRQPSAKGIGRESKRHDLERPATPGLHGSDLQQGEVSELERGRRIAPIQQQERGQNPNPPSRRRQAGPATPRDREGNPVDVPDPIDFLADRTKGVGRPQGRQIPYSSKGASWLPVLESMAAGPGSSGLLAAALVKQARNLRAIPQRRAAVVDMRAIDDGIEAMLDEGI